jgi:hypothetical protein
VNFSVAHLGQGWCYFTGTVQDEAPGGLVVTFSGVPTVQGQTATTAADGTFSLTIQLRTDGTDNGNVSAVTYDRLGLKSNEPYVAVNP